MDTYTDNKEKSYLGMTPTVLIAVVVLVLILLAAGAYFFFFRKSSPIIAPSQTDQMLPVIIAPLIK